MNEKMTENREQRDLNSECGIKKGETGKVGSWEGRKLRGS
jgi:hypothetical protein